MTTDNRHERPSPAWAAIQAGGLAGLGGILFGGTSGIAGGKKPLVLWTLMTGFQWATLGGTYWGLRSSILNEYPEPDITPSTRLYASAASGCLSFAAVGLVIRGRQNVLPGAFMGSVFGFAGQAGFNYFDKDKYAEMSRPKRDSIWKKAADSEWMPFKSLTDDEHADLLKERLLRAEAEIAIIDDEIASLRDSQVREKAEQQK
ncbi:hypothetical protein BT63DRAFT_325812 [Microthyrium microscopicum]|uniref:Tim17-domain-containing protein n=1 Tax=Microthyrium microscopicum TaxID=703497 RepID=A0A6A6U4Y4_9PEZI|nr:hypothetical protein BT63DRAFT_325812 [Microthyrium microscopicum]